MSQHSVYKSITPTAGSPMHSPARAAISSSQRSARTAVSAVSSPAKRTSVEREKSQHIENAVENEPEPTSEPTSESESDEHEQLHPISVSDAIVTDQRKLDNDDNDNDDDDDEHLKSQHESETEMKEDVDDQSSDEDAMQAETTPSSPLKQGQKRGRGRPRKENEPTKRTPTQRITKRDTRAATAPPASLELKPTISKQLTHETKQKNKKKAATVAEMVTDLETYYKKKLGSDFFTIRRLYRIDIEAATDVPLVKHDVAWLEKLWKRI